MFYSQIEGDDMDLGRYGHEYGAEPVDQEAMTLLKEKAGFPNEDPIYGPDGPLPRLWKARLTVDGILKRL